MKRGKRDIFNNRFLFLLQGCAVACLVGCATTHVQPMLEYGGAAQLQPPVLALIHDFAISPAHDVPDQTSGSESDHKAATARSANTVLSNTLIEEMKKLGLPAQKASDSIPAGENTLSIEGEFLCLEEGSRIKRMLIGFGAGAAQVNTIVRIYLHSGNHKELLQEFMATVETPEKAGIGPAMLGIDPLAGGGIISTTVSSGVSAASETWGSDIEALSDALAREIVKSFVGFAIRQGWTTAVMY
jgi:hypothetical protein